MRVRIIGVGQPVAGDDGAGFAVIDTLRGAPLPGDVELATARDASELLDLLDGCERAVIVDAATGMPPGSLRALRPEELAALRSSAVSSHGLGVAEALQLARAVYKTPVQVDVIAVGIDPPSGYGGDLSPRVRAALVRARRIILELALAPPGRETPLGERA